LHTQAAFQQHLLAHKQQQGAKQAAALQAQQAQQAAAGAAAQQAVAGDAAPAARQGFSEEAKPDIAQNHQGFARSGGDQPGSAPGAAAGVSTMQPPQSGQRLGFAGSPDVPPQQQQSTSVPPAQQPRPLLQSPSLPPQQQANHQQAMQMQMVMQARQAQAQAMMQQQQQAGGQRPSAPQVRMQATCAYAVPKSMRRSPAVVYGVILIRSSCWTVT